MARHPRPLSREMPSGERELAVQPSISALLGVSEVLDSSPARILESKGKPRELTTVLFFGS